MRKKTKKIQRISLLKKKLWSLCRDIIRRKYINKDGSFTCYTCGANIPEARLAHTGHFIASSVCSTEMRYNLENLRIQDYVCNIHRSGNWIAFEEHLIRDGIDVEALKKRNRETSGLSYGIDWYLYKILEYKQILNK